jgi:hypothetical protein
MASIYDNPAHVAEVEDAARINLEIRLKGKRLANAAIQARKTEIAKLGVDNIEPLTPGDIEDRLRTVTQLRLT